RAFALLRELPNTPERLSRELQLELRLGTLLAYTEGYASAGAERAYRRANEICPVEDAPAQFEAVGGLFRIALFRGEATIGRRLGDEFIRIAERTKDPIRLGIAHQALGQLLIHQGEPLDALRHVKIALELCRANWHDALMPRYGLHFEVILMGSMG